MRREKTSVSQEDYLKAIWEIVQEEQVPISARLAEDLGKFAAIRLSEAQPGNSYEVLRVYEKDPKFLDFLAGLNLQPGARFRIKQRGYDETMVLAVTGNLRTQVHLGKPATSRIWVRLVR